MNLAWYIQHLGLIELANIVFFYEFMQILRIECSQIIRYIFIYICIIDSKFIVLFMDSDYYSTNLISLPMQFLIV